MKKSLKIILASLVILSTSIVSCKKYDEGPAFSLRTKEARLVGKWIEKEIHTDGVLTNSQNNGNWEEYKENGEFVADNSGSGVINHWEFSEDKTKILKTPNKGNFEKVIVKLTNDELWYYVVTPFHKEEYHLEKE